MAQIYISHELVAEAIEMLEPLAEAGSQSAAVHRTLGDLYRHAGLSLHAQESYTRALELAEADQDVEGQAAAQVALGEVYATLGDADEAVRWLEKAQSGYAALGDTQRASELGERMADLGH